MGEKLDPSNAFAALSWFNLILRTLIMVPRGFQHWSEMAVSAKRIGAFLADVNEIESAPSSAEEGNVVVEMKQCSFSWLRDASSSTLQSVSLHVASGELLVVVGEIASGKSSLLSALCGEMYLNSGSMVKRKDRTILVPQHPFILNTSVRENITFGLAYDPVTFKKVMTACSLEPDVASMPAGISTEIGERGITLSGGQRQRIGLARGVYAALFKKKNKDPVLLLCDDVLSALDATVASDVFSGVFSRKRVYCEVDLTSLLFWLPTLVGVSEQLIACLS